MDVVAPKTLDETLAEMGAHPQTVLIAGGTDLMVAINFGRARPERVLSVRRLQELQQLRVDGLVSVGAGVTYTRMLAALGNAEPAMVQAARTVGSPQIRNAGTLGGNLGTCSPAGDTLPVLAALDAEVVVRSQNGERRVRFQDWMRGPKKPALEPGEIVVAAEWNAAGRSQCFLKAGTRNAMVIAVANLAMVVDRARRRVGIGLGSVGPVILRATEAERHAEALFEESGWDRPIQVSEAAASQFGELAAKAAQPIDDQRGTERYRRHIVSVMARRALTRTGRAV